MVIRTHFTLPRSTAKLATIACVALILAGFVIYQAVSGLTDTDGDGYASIASGGNDCQDTSHSVFKNTASCDGTANPAFLASTGDPDTVNDIADHGWMQGPDGVYHLYFQWNGPDTDIAHFTSTNLKTISYVGTALTHDVTKYYGRIWAPYILKNGNTYYMYFTGVEKYVSASFYRQRIGLATSTNLTDWTLYPGNNCAGTSGNGCVYECDTSWTTWGNGTAFDEQCRDPMVIRDAANNRWVMFATIRRNDGSGSEGTNVAYSTDLVNWSDAGYIKATQRLTAGQGGVGGQTTGGTSENPFAFAHDGTYYLTFTDWSDAEPPAMVQYVKSTTLVGDASGSTNWTYQGSTPDAGVNAIEVLKVEGDTWLMTQSISNSNSGDSTLHTRHLRVKRIVWNSDGSFSTSKLSDLDCRVSSASINPGASEVCSDGLDNNCSGQVDEASVCSSGNDGMISGPSGVAINGTVAAPNGVITTVSLVARRPVITGVAEPNANVTLAFFPGPLVYWTTSDANGKWTIAITDNLPKADYDVYARVAKDSQTTAVALIARLNMASAVYLPIPTVTSPAANELLISTTPTITGFTRSGTAVTVYIDGIKNGTTLKNTHTSVTAGFDYVPLRALAKGTHTLAVEAADTNGNYSRRSAPFVFTIDDPTIGPTLFSIKTAGSTTSLNGVGWGDTDVIVYDNGKQIDIFYIGGSGAQRFSRPLPSLGAGAHRLTARAYDAASKPSRISNALNFIR